MKRLGCRIGSTLDSAQRRSRDSAGRVQHGRTFGQSDFQEPHGYSVKTGQSAAQVNPPPRENFVEAEVLVSKTGLGQGVSLSLLLEQSDDGVTWWPLAGTAWDDVLAVLNSGDKSGRPNRLALRVTEQLVRHDVFTGKGWGEAHELQEGNAHYHQLALAGRLRVTVSTSDNVGYSTQIRTNLGKPPPCPLGQQSASLVGTFAGAQTNSNTTLTTGSRTTVSGTLITVHVAVGNSPTSINVSSDSKGNTYQESIEASFNGTAVRLATDYNNNGTRGASHTCTTTWNSSGAGPNWATITAQEWSGVSSSPTVNTNSASGTGTSASVAVTPSTGTALVVGLASYDAAASDIDVTNGTLAQEQDPGNDTQAQSVGYKVAASGSTTIGWTIGSSLPWGAVATAFTEDAGGAASSAASSSSVRSSSSSVASSSSVTSSSSTAPGAPAVLMTGFEMGSALEFSITAGTISFQSAVTAGPWSVYALRVNPTGTGTGQVQLQGFLNTTGAFNAIAVSVPTLYTRFMFRVDTLPAANDEEFFRVSTTGAATKLTLRITSGGLIAAYDATPTLLVTGTKVLSTGVWYRIELKVGSGAGAPLEWKVDGVVDVSTTATLSAVDAGFVTIGKVTNRNGNSVDYYYDDLLASGSAYPGAGRSILLAPVSAGTYQTWTRGGADTGANWSQVSEVPPDGDTTYLLSTSVVDNAEIEQVAPGSAVVSGTVNAVKSVNVNKRDGAAAGAVRARTRFAGTDVDTSADRAPLSNYTAIGQLFPTNPVTSAAFAVSDLDSIQVGAVEKDATNKTRMTGAYVMVDSTTTLTASSSSVRSSSSLSSVSSSARSSSVPSSPSVSSSSVRPPSVSSSPVPSVSSISSSLRSSSVSSSPAPVVPPPASPSSSSSVRPSSSSSAVPPSAVPSPSPSSSSIRPSSSSASPVIPPVIVSSSSLRPSSSSAPSVPPAPPASPSSSSLRPSSSSAPSVPSVSPSAVPVISSSSVLPSSSPSVPVIVSSSVSPSVPPVSSSSVRPSSSSPPSTPSVAPSPSSSVRPPSVSSSPVVSPSSSVRPSSSSLFISPGVSPAPSSSSVRPSSSSAVPPSVPASPSSSMPSSSSRASSSSLRPSSSSLFVSSLSPSSVSPVSPTVPPSFSPAPPTSSSSSPGIVTGNVILDILILGVSDQVLDIMVCQQVIMDVAIFKLGNVDVVTL